MKNESDTVRRFLPSPSFSKTAREWILSSALYDGIEDEDIRQIEMLLAERGANPNVLLPEYGITPFHLAVANESSRFAVQATDICLQHGADPNVRSEDGLTPVHLAAMWGCAEVLQVLLASGGNPWLVDCFNKNAFDYAQEEEQLQCNNILKMNCNSQPKPSSHSKSPYQLNLKRVILYKNDLQIVYEALPSKSQKCVSTQTSSKTNSDPSSAEGSFNGFIENTNIHSKTHNSKKISVVEIKNNERNCYESTQKERKICDLKKNRCFSSENTNHVSLSSRLKEVIVKHRRNSTVFEYSPPKEDKDSFSSGVASWRDMDSSSEVTSHLVSELIEKLEQTNKIRQSLKSSDKRINIMKNITQRKKPPHQLFEPAVSTLGEASAASDQYESVHSQSNIGFVLNDSQDRSTMSKTTHNPATSNVGSPPSIGFMLDNLNESQLQSRGSSFFSDIASDVEAYSAPVQHFPEIMTEDENSSAERQFTKYSSTDSLYPYVSCNDVNTREVESSEYFESCEEGLKTVAESHTQNMQPKEFESETTHLNPGGNSSVNSVLDSILNSIDTEKKTPVNPKMVTSTPERQSSGGGETTFSSAVEFNSDSEKRGWVEANVLSSEEDEYVSISEEYEYTDMDEGVVLIEKRYLLNDVSVSTNGKKKQKSTTVPSSGSEESEVSTISGSEGAYDTDELRRALQEYGLAPGPITGNTKRVYLRKLKRCRKKPQPLPQIGQPAYSPELLKTLEAPCEHLLFEWSHLEDSMSASFSCSRRQWREGMAKTSFTYLLLDPRVAHNLPACATRDPHPRLWADFLRSVFYVGKGKRSRPYAHLYKAVSVWHQRDSCNSKKVQRILDIWNSGQGVVCLHVFLNIIPVEAFTREAAMICALTLPQLTNEKSGEFYGSAACWSFRLKRRLGSVLLHRAYKVFLAEGERQLRPADID